MPRSRAVTRARIVHGAYLLFYREGFARVSMDDIAAGASVTDPLSNGHAGSAKRSRCVLLT
jgi:AcrR family transcriptional regulator